MTSISHYGKCVPLLFWPMAILLVATGTSRTGATGRLVQMDSDSRVAARIDAGEIQGVRDSTTGVLVFRGIPFAAPPLGPLRWTPPKLPEAWQGTRQASTFGARCPQQVGPAGQGGDTPPASSEDCLTLNVWTTATNSRSRRPVLVWLHGGGGVGGSGAIPAQDGRALSQKGLVVVTVNYRLGLLGYLAHPALTAESPRHVSGNYALLDQVAALQWVQRNIARFAGDPARVTVAGASAGARGVATLLVSPLARGLFQRAILQSGTGLDDAVEPLEAAEAHGQRVAAMLGIHGTTADTAAALRGVPPATLVSTFAAWRSIIGGRPAPTIARSAVDGWSIPEPIDASLQHGTLHRVPILIGVNADEGTVAIRETAFESVADFHAALRRWYGDDGTLAGAYPVTAPTNLLPTFQRLWGDDAYGAPARAFARLAAARGNTVYFYFFTRVATDTGAARGSFHGSQVAFAFGQPTRDPGAEATPYDDTLAQVMSGYWAAFAASGDPNGNGRPAWPTYDAKLGQYMELGPTIGVKRGLRVEQWDAIDRIARVRGAIRP